MRIRKSFAGAFVLLCLLAAGAGFTPNDYSIPTYKQSDKVLHFLTFFLITLCFYWILETSRRKVVHITLLVCTVGLGFGSEVAQGLLPNGRQFDYYDILANVVGSAGAIGICNWYHKRMLERKRAARGYAAVAGEDLDDRDVELGEGIGGQEEGIVRPVSGTAAVEAELDNWDENAEDWDEAEGTDATNGHAGAANGGEGDLGVADKGKRND